MKIYSKNYEFTAISCAQTSKIQSNRYLSNFGVNSKLGEAILHFE